MREATFVLKDSGTDEYPGDGLRIALEETKEVVCDTRLLRSLGYRELRASDRVHVQVTIWRDRPSIETDEVP